MSRAVYKAIAAELEAALAALDAAKRLAEALEPDEARRVRGELGYAAQHLPSASSMRERGRNNARIARYVSRQYARQDLVSVLWAHRASTTRNPKARDKKARFR